MIGESLFIYFVLSGLLFFLGLAGTFLARHFIRKIIALNITGGAVFLLFVTTARGGEGPFPDPVPHAMVITGLVVAVSASALALHLARRIHEATGRDGFGEEPGE